MVGAAGACHVVAIARRRRLARIASRRREVATHAVSLKGFTPVGPRPTECVLPHMEMRTENFARHTPTYLHMSVCVTLTYTHILAHVCVCVYVCMYVHAHGHACNIPVLVHEYDTCAAKYASRIVHELRPRSLSRRAHTTDTSYFRHL